jgi:hypothetical protein
MTFILTSRLLLNLKESMNAVIVSHGDDTHDTADATMSDIVFRQLEGLCLE